MYLLSIFQTENCWSSLLSLNIVRAFTELYTALDETTKTNAKTDALVKYLKLASDMDAAWAIWFLSGRKLRQVIPSRKLAEWATPLRERLLVACEELHAIA